MSRKWIRWVPAAAVPVAVIVAGAVVVPLAANAAPNLPAKSPTQVLQLVADSKVKAFSGDVTVTSDLGLPDLSGIAGVQTNSSGSALDLLTGSHDLRVYVDGDKSRVQLEQKLAEKDVVVTPTDVWTYDSSEKKAMHIALPAHTATKPDAAAESPDAVATQLVKALEPTSDLSVTTAQTVAGRDAYTLVLAPKATDTLVGNVSIAVDAATGLPLSVEVSARDAGSPAWSIAFSSVKLATPSAKLFDFTAPKSATVTEQKLPSKSELSAEPDTSSLPKPTVAGSGWDAIVSLPADGDATSLTSSKQFLQLSTAVSGGRLIHTSLVNVLVTDSGEVLAGSVPASALAAAAK